MSIKTKLVRGARKVLPLQLIRPLEESYRRSRVKLVAAAYGNPAKKLKVIAVTGTNGKTTTINYINQILKTAGLKTAMFSTALIEVAGESKINDLNATVATTTQMQKFFKKAKKAGVDYVVLEITSHSLHQHKLAGVPVEVAVMTNLTQDHLDYHKTMENYAKAKAKMFASSPNIIVLNRDDEWFEFFDKYPAAHQKITYGESKDSDVKITNSKLDRVGSRANLLIDGNTKLDLSLKLPGKYNIYNAAAAVAATYALGIKIKAIVSGVESLDGVPGRFERVVSDKNYDVVVDYAHTPDALEKLLQSAKSIAKNRVILVFGATGDRDKAKRPIMGEIAAKLADRIILTDDETYSENPQKIRNMVMEGIKKGRGEAITNEIGDRYEAIAKALSIVTRGDIVLVTGMGHEQFRIMNDGKQPWNDAESIREILAKKS